MGESKPDRRRRKGVRLFNMEVEADWHGRLKGFAAGQQRSMGSIARDAVDLYQALAPAGAPRTVVTEAEGPGWRQSIVTRIDGTRFRVRVEHGTGSDDEARRVTMTECDPPGLHRWVVE